MAEHVPSRPDGPDARIFSLAAEQHGVVSRAQLLASGIRRGALEHRLASGLLCRMHQGVYRVGPVAAAHAREMAAVLACGEAAVLSLRSAGALLWSLAEEGQGELIDVSVPHGKGRKREGVLVHQCRTLRQDETTRLHGIPVTTAARTLLDLARVLRPGPLERALAEAFVLRLTTRAEMRRLLARHPRSAGIGLLQELLASPLGPARTRSEAEVRFLSLVRTAGLPVPEANVTVLGRERDFFWREARFVVEVDGARFHSAPGRQQRDRRRNAELEGAGYRVIRVTWEEIEKAPVALAARLAGTLAERRPR